MSSELVGSNKLRSRNPANLEVLGEVSVSSAADVQAVAARSRKAFQSWSQLPLNERLQYIERFRQVVLERKEELATLISQETGKPRIEAFSGELFSVLENCRWLQDNVGNLVAPQKVAMNPFFFWRKRAYNVFESIGVVAVVSPWNYPFAIPVSTVLCAIATGNTVILKPSPKTPMIGEAIQNLFVRAGFPEDVVSVVHGFQETGKALVLSDINRISFTGGVAGGRAINTLAAERLIPVSLELAGKHPAIVLEDADLDTSAQAIVWAAFTNAGQACASIERLFVMRPLLEKLETKVTELTKALRLGNGMLPYVDVGPMIDQEQVDRVKAQVDQAIASGARLLAGGNARPDLGGHFYEPTVLSGVTNQMHVYTQETFGPVLPIIVVDSAEEAVALANNSLLGLGASIWTTDLKRGERLARQLQTGMVWINDALYSHICPNAPWGGIKNSGLGRRNGSMSLYDFVYLKHVGVEKPGLQEWQYPYSEDRSGLLAHAMDVLHGSGVGKRVRALGNMLPKWFKTRR